MPNEQQINIGKVLPRPIVEEMQESYLDYAMSVIVARALPDVRDGLKPVHRRILYTMHAMGLRSSARFRKSAAVVGEVLGKYHPHGDIAVYDASVRMAQDFSMRYPLIAGQGNFGCFTKDTTIKLADGRDLNFGDLVKEHAQDKKNYTYTVNSQGRIAIAEIKNPRKTRTNAELVKVTLDNGAEIRCTPSHLFMLRDGSYKAARDLKPGESLMPIYQRLSKKQDRLNREGYILIYQNNKAEWVPAHHLADNYNLTLKKYTKQTGRVRHHIDFKVRAQLYSYGCATSWENGIKKYYNDDHKLVVHELRKNHKIVCVEHLHSREDVYDLTIDKSHNFALAAGVFVHNSMDGDAAAAMRYTEVKLAPIAEELLADIEKDTVAFVPNYDGTHEEPRVLPAKLPNLLLNGSMGIAVGMATNIPPHNLAEICAGVLHLIDHPDCSLDDLMQFIPGPDFPTGGLIYNKTDIKQAYATGRGSIVMRARAEVIDVGHIVVTELPYAVNKADLVSKIADLVRDKKIEGIKDLRDESNKDGVRIVIELKKDTYPKKILNQLYDATALQDAFHVNMLALLDGIQPRLLSLKSVLEEYVKHRKEIVRRRTAFELDRAKQRAHILEGLKIAILNIDRVIAVIKKSEDREEAKVNLMRGFKLTEAQSLAILDMRLHQLAALERLKIENELKEKKALIEELEAILASEKRITGVVRDEVNKLKAEYSDKRRTEIIAHAVKEFRVEDLIPNEPTIVMITADGYIKRLPPETFKRQTRGGKGVMGLTTKETDVVEHLFSTTTHADLLFFTTRGRVFKLKAYEVPQTTRTAKGQAVVNFLELGPAEKVSAVLSLSELGDYKYLVMTTAQGLIKKVDLEAFEVVRRSGLIAIKLRQGDRLEWVRPSSGGDEIMLVSAKGQSIRFKETDVRPMGRVASGVRGMRLKGSDQIIGMDAIDAKLVQKDLLELFVLMENGFGKRTSVKSYKLQRRGGSGVKTAKVTPKTGEVVGAFIANAKDERDLIVISKQGQVIRTPFRLISVQGRATQGVRVMRFKEPGDRVASVTFV